MADSTTGTAGAPPAADDKASKLYSAYAAEQVRAEAKIHATHKAATTGEKVTQEAIEAAGKARDEALKAIQDKIHGRFGTETEKAAYKAAHAQEQETYLKGIESIKGMSKGFTAVMSRLHDNPKTAVAVGAALAAAGAMLPGKEVEKADGTTEKKGSLFKKALVSMGAAVVIGATLNNFGPLKGFAGKIAAERLATAAKGAAAGAAI